MIFPTTRTILLGFVPLFVLLAGGGTPAAVQTAWILFALLMAAWIADGLFLTPARWLTLRREAPDRIHIDQPAPVVWWIENRGRFPAELQLRDQPPEGVEVTPRELRSRIGPQARQRLEYSLVPSVRGDLKFGNLDYRVGGRLGLAWKQRRQPAEQPVRCYPQLANWKAGELAVREAMVRQAGSHRYRWRGTGTMFESLRDYTSEDDIRWVDWKATARARRPISRNFESERHQQVMLLVDASRMMTTYCGRRTKFDAVLEAAVLTAQSAADQGDAVGLLVFSDKADVYLHPRRERSQVGAIMNSLYALTPRLVEPDFEAALTLAARRNRRRTLMILLTDVTVIESSRRMLTYLRLLTPRHLPLVVVIADETVQQLEVHSPENAEELYQVGVASELLQQRDQLLEVLRSSGAAVLDSPADQVATGTIRMYLDLKRRLRL